MVTTAWEIAAAVVDPEIPVITIADLGVLREVEIDADGAVSVAITPTYSGCPAIDAIKDDLGRAFHAAGYADVSVRTVLSPAWSTDQITAAGRAALAEYGIAPPAKQSWPVVGDERAVTVPLSVRCPQCGSLNTEEISHFGSTACKALRRCKDCREPFDHLKTI